MITNKENIPGYTRIHFKSDAIKHPRFTPGAYIKVLVGPDLKTPVYRSYTLSQVTNIEAIIDLVQHSGTGPGANWRESLAIDDQFEFKPPGPRAQVPDTTQHLFVYADRTSLPAIATQLSNHSFKQVTLWFSESTMILESYLGDHSRSITIVNNQNDLLQSIECAEKKTSSIWMAGERNHILALREIINPIKNQFLSCYMSSYWQKNQTDEEHRRLKKLDPK